MFIKRFIQKKIDQSVKEHVLAALSDEEIVQATVELGKEISRQIILETLNDIKKGFEKP